MFFKKLFLLTLLPAVMVCASCEKKDIVNPITPPFGQTDPEPDPDPSTGGADPMIICTFNIRYANTTDSYPGQAEGSASWNNRKDAVKKFFDTVKPDLVGLQEIRQEQSQWFFQTLGSDYGYYDVSRDNASGGSVATVKGEGVGLLYRKDRFELVSKDFFWLDTTPRERPAQNTDGTFGDWKSACRRITVYAALKDKKHGNAVMYFFPTHYDHQSEVARKNSAEFMVNQIKTLCKVTDIKEADMAIFHVGDLNTGSSDGQLNSLNAAMNYARTAAGGSDQYTGTFNGFGDSNKIIDHIYYGGKSVTPVKYWVDRTNYGVPFLSDHYPVLFKWEYK